MAPLNLLPKIITIISSSLDRDKVVIRAVTLIVAAVAVVSPIVGTARLLISRSGSTVPSAIY